MAFLDGTTIRAHQKAAGAAKKGDLQRSETSVKRRDQLLGAVGEAIFAIDQTFGMASVRDKGSGMFHVRCRVSADHEPLAKGSAVLLVDYDAKDGLYTVIPYELGGDARDKALTAGNGNGKARTL